MLLLTILKLIIGKEKVKDEDQIWEMEQHAKLET